MLFITFRTVNMGVLLTITINDKKNSNILLPNIRNGKFKVMLISLTAINNIRSVILEIKTTDVKLLKY